MSLISGTMTRYDANALREDLENTITNISPEDTVFLSSIGRQNVRQTLHEWPSDTLASVDGSNAQFEGDDASFTTPASVVRSGNYCQISRKTCIVSDTLEVVDKAGRTRELAYQMTKRGAELKRDQETILLRAQGGNAGGTGTARTLAALLAWIKTNDDFYTTDGASPVWTAGVPSAARTDGGTLRALTETILKNVIQSTWTSGGTPRVLMVGPVNKQRVSGFSGIATRNFDLSNTSPKPTAIIAAADVYVSDFGVIRVVPNRFQRERDAFLLDWAMLKLGVLRGYRTVPLAKTGDAEKQMLITEYTLIVRQEAGLGGAFDLTTT